MNHGKHGNHTMIMPWTMTTMPRSMAAMPSSWHDHDHVSPWSWYDHGKIMAWQPCFLKLGKVHSQAAPCRATNYGSNPELWEKCYFKQMAKHLQWYVSNSATFKNNKRVDGRKICAELLNTFDGNFWSKHRFNKVSPHLPTSSAHENLMTSMEVFSRGFFCLHYSTGETINKTILEVTTRYRY